MKKMVKLLSVSVLSLVVLCTVAYAAFNYFQGFVINTGDWVAYQAITRVASLGGTLGLPSAAGNFHAELQNLHDGYQPQFGNGGYSFYGGKDSVYHGDFFQSIDVYINANWATPVPYPTEPAFWIDMTPYHADPNNYGAEHNFRLTANGGSVDVRVDGQTIPTATITKSGWYTFLMTYRKASHPTDPVATDMNVYDPNHNLIGTTQVFATSPGGPFASSDLRGNGYVWITVWQNGFAGDVLALDNQRTGLLPFRPIPTDINQCKAGGWQFFAREDNSTFKNQGDCVQFVNTGK